MVIAIPGGMIALVAAIWFGAATIVAYQIEHARLDTASNGDEPAASARTEPTGEHLRLALPGERAKRAWFVAGKRRAAVVLIPPSGAAAEAMSPYAQFLNVAGFATLAMDSADRGRALSWGWRDRAAVRAGVAELRRRGYARLGAIGLFEGGVAALLAQAEGGTFEAIVIDGAYANLESLLLRMPALRAANPGFARTVIWEVGLWIGRSPAELDATSAAARLGSCRLLVIQQRAGALTTVADAGALRAAAGIAAELWIVEAAGNSTAIDAAPKQYAERVLGLFESQLADPDAPERDGPKRPAATAYMRGGTRSTSNVERRISGSFSTSHGPWL
jgi:hypothetical protein